MIKGPTQDLNSLSYARLISSCLTIFRWPGGHSEYGSLNSRFKSLSLTALVSVFMPLAIVPPEGPPRMALTRSLTLSHLVPNFLYASS